MLHGAVIIIHVQGLVFMVVVLAVVLTVKHQVLQFAGALHRA